MGVFKHHEITYEKKLGIVFYKTNDKSYREIAAIVGCLRSTAFSVCKKFYVYSTEKNPSRVGRPKKFSTTRQERSFLRTLRCNRFQSLNNILKQVLEKTKLNSSKKSLSSSTFCAKTLQFHTSQTCSSY